MLIWESDLSTLLFDGHPGRHEHLAALKQTGDGGRLEAYPTRYRWNLRLPKIVLATAITEAER
jgi:hypothetical protein